jgi:hypothetical protein
VPRVEVPVDGHQPAHIAVRVREHPHVKQLRVCQLARGCGEHGTQHEQSLYRHRAKLNFAEIRVAGPICRARVH